MGGGVMVGWCALVLHAAVSALHPLTHPHTETCSTHSRLCVTAYAVPPQNNGHVVIDDCGRFTTPTPVHTAAIQSVCGDDCGRFTTPTPVHTAAIQSVCGDDCGRFTTPTPVHPLTIQNVHPSTHAWCRPCSTAIHSRMVQAVQHCHPLTHGAALPHTVWTVECMHGQNQPWPCETQALPRLQSFLAWARRTMMELLRSSKACMECYAPHSLLCRDVGKVSGAPLHRHELGAMQAPHPQHQHRCTDCNSQHQPHPWRTSGSSQTLTRRHSQAALVDCWLDLAHVRE
jgi:hypothetical protein